MKLVPFSILTALSVLYGILTVTETTLYQRWERAMAEQRDIQAKVAYFNQLGGYLESLLKRLALDAQTDPELMNLLKENKINLVFSQPQKGKAQDNPAPAPVPNGTPAPVTPGNN